MRSYVGADLDTRAVTLAVVSEQGALLREKRLAPDPQEVLRFLAPWRPDLSLAVEASPFTYPFLDPLQEAGIEVHLAHPLMLKAIAYAKVKTDRVDALTLAQILRLGMLPESYIYPKELRPLRDLARRRARLVEARSLGYRWVQTLYRQRGIAPPDRNRVKHPADGAAGLFPAEEDRRYLAGLDTITAAHSQAIENIEDLLHEKCLLDERYRLLMGVPGIGKTYAQLVMLEVGDISRFPSHRRFISYARLTPGLYQSGKTSRRGRNPHQGNRHLKVAFRQAALFAVRHDPHVRAFFDRLIESRPRIVAYAIVARRLAVGVFYVLTRRVPFHSGRLFARVSPVV